MSSVEFPPAERVNLFGNFTRGELIGAAVATALFGVGAMTGALVPALVVTALIVVWTFTPTRRHPFRLIVPAALRWSLRRDRSWSAGVKGAVKPPSFLRGVDVQLADRAVRVAADRGGRGAPVVHGDVQRGPGGVDVLERQRAGRRRTGRGARCSARCAWSATAS